MNESLKLLLAGMIHFVVFLALITTLKLFVSSAYLNDEEFGVLAFGYSLTSTAVHVFTLRFGAAIFQSNVTRIVLISSLAVLPCLVVSYLILKMLPVESMAVLLPVTSWIVTKLFDKSTLQIKI